MRPRRHHARRPDRGTGGVKPTYQCRSCRAKSRHPSTQRKAVGCLDFGQRPKFILSARPAGSRRARHERTKEGRSEEHTSELQSLMRISYAVFCLKKKTTQISKYTQT